MSRIKVQIEPAIGTPDDHGRTEHPVRVRYQGEDHSARVTFAIVNGRAVWGVGPCSDEAFDAINAALAYRERDLVDALRAARKQA